MKGWTFSSVASQNSPGKLRESRGYKMCQENILCAQRYLWHALLAWHKAWQPALATALEWYSRSSREANGLLFPQMGLSCSSPIFYHRNAMQNTFTNTWKALLKTSAEVIPSDTWDHYYNFPVFGVFWWLSRELPFQGQLLSEHYQTY